MQKFGLVLSGGGARGAAHVGVLQALNENGIFPDAISGASSGALIGALYCQGLSPLKILEISKSDDFLKIFKLSMLPNDWNRLARLRELLLQYIPVDNFDALRIPLSVCVTNLNKGKSEYVESGELIDYVLASCAVPIIFKSIVIQGNTYVDGGVLNNLPIEPLEKENMKVMGVSICPHQEMESIVGMRAISERIFHMTIWNNIANRLKQCDIALEIAESYKFSMFNTTHSDELYQIGYEAGIAIMSEIKTKLSIK